MGAVLHGFCHPHHSHTSNDNNINVKAAAAHVLGDLLQSVGVLVAAVIIRVFPSAKVADPICTLLFSAVVLFATVRVVCDAARILLEASPKGAEDVVGLVKRIEGVRNVHELHVWTLAPGKDVAAVHLAVGKLKTAKYVWSCPFLFKTG